MKSILPWAIFIAAISAASVAAGCGGGSSVQGSTYEDSGGAVKIEFQSGGKALVSMGPMQQPCTYVQDGKKVDLTCEKEKIAFILGDDGALNGEAGSNLPKLIKKKA